MSEKVKFGDLFAGGGGVSTGAYSIPGLDVVWALNHDEQSIKLHEANHPETRHYKADIRNQNEKVLEKIDILWASLECTNYSNAKGGLPRDADSRTLAWELPRYALHTEPSYIIIENVREFMAWGPLDEKGKPIERKKGIEYLKWVQYMKDIGWSNYEYRMLNAADFGCHTKRIRYFGIFSKPGHKISWKEQTHHPQSKNLLNLPKWKPAKECINFEKEGKSIFNRKKPLSEKTIQRIARGINKFYPSFTFLMKYYGTGDNVVSIDEPLHTITTKDRHAIVNIEKKHFITDHCWASTQQTLEQPLNTQLTWQTKQLITIEKKKLLDSLEKNNPEFDIKMRFLSADELAKISGFPDGYFNKIKISKKDQIKMIGNAVPIEQAIAVIEPINNNLIDYIALNKKAIS